MLAPQTSFSISFSHFFGYAFSSVVNLANTYYPNNRFVLFSSCRHLCLQEHNIQAMEAKHRAAREAQQYVAEHSASGESLRRVGKVDQ